MQKLFDHQIAQDNSNYSIYSNRWWAQKIDNSDPIVINKVRVKGSIYSLGATTITLTIEADSSGAPSGTALATATLDGDADLPVSTVYTGAEWAEADLDVPVYLDVQKGNYWLVAKSSASNSNDAFMWNYTSAGSRDYNKGAAFSTTSGSSWTALSANDMMFEVWGTEVHDYSDSGVSANWFGSTTKSAQTFTAEATYNVKGVWFYMFEQASSGSATVKLQGVTSSGLPDDSNILATSSSVVHTNVGPSVVWVYFEFPGTGAPVVQGQQYAAVIEATTTLWCLYVDGTQPYAGGTVCNDTGGGWASSSSDCQFAIYCHNTPVWDMVDVFHHCGVRAASAPYETMWELKWDKQYSVLSELNSYDSGQTYTGDCFPDRNGDVMACNQGGTVDRVLRDYSGKDTSFASSGTYTASTTCRRVTQNPGNLDYALAQANSTPVVCINEAGTTTNWSGGGGAHAGWDICWEPGNGEYVFSEDVSGYGSGPCVTGIGPSSSTENRYYKTSSATYRGVYRSPHNTNLYGIGDTSSTSIKVDKWTAGTTTPTWSVTISGIKYGWCILEHSNGDLYIGTRESSTNYGTVWRISSETGSIGIANRYDVDDSSGSGKITSIDELPLTGDIIVGHSKGDSEDGNNANFHILSQTLEELAYGTWSDTSGLGSRPCINIVQDEWDSGTTSNTFGTYYYKCLPFQVDYQCVLDKVELKMKGTNSNGGNLAIYELDGSNDPTGSPLAGADLGILPAYGSYVWQEFDLIGCPTLDTTKTYGLVIYFDGSGTVDIASGTAQSGLASRHSTDGSTWADAGTRSILYRVWGKTSATASSPFEGAYAELQGDGTFDVVPTIKVKTEASMAGSGTFLVSAPGVTNSNDFATIMDTPIDFHAPNWVRHDEGHDPRWSEAVPTEMAGYLLGTQEAQDIPAQPIQNKSGVHRAPVHDFWYEKIHLLPRLVQELGNIVSQQSFDVELYNAHRTDDIVITSVTNNLDSGVSIIGVPATPFTINSQRSMSAQCIINTTGGFTIDSSYTFHAEDGTDYTFYITGSRIVLFPIRPEAPLREHLIFDTKILEAVDGTEQRIANRKTPRSMFEMTIKESRKRMEMLLFDRQSKVVATPAWHEPSYLTSDVTAGDLTINVNTTDYANFYVGGYAIIYKDEFTYDALLIDSMTSTSLTFDSASANNYASSNKKIHVMPLMVAYFNHEVSAAKNVYNQQTFSIRLTVDATDNDIADASGWSTYDGKVFLDDPNMVDGNVLAEVLERKVLVLDNITGTFDEHSQWDKVKRRSFKGFKTNTREELWKLRKLLHYLKGQQVSFFIPTFSKDLIPNQTLLNTSSVFTMDSIGYTVNAYQRAPKDYFRMHLKDGTILTRTIVGSAEISASEEQLTVDSPWPYDIDPEDIERVEFLEKVRINVDDIVITHYNALGQSKCFVPTKEVFD